MWAYRDEGGRVDRTDEWWPRVHLKWWQALPLSPWLSATALEAHQFPAQRLCHRFPRRDRHEVHPHFFPGALAIRRISRSLVEELGQSRGEPNQ